MTDMLERMARAMCFAGFSHDAGNGELVMERSCDCKTPADCCEWNVDFPEQISAALREARPAFDEAGQKIIDGILSEE